MKRIIKALSLILVVTLICSLFLIGCDDEKSTVPVDYSNNGTNEYISIEGNFTDKKLPDFDAVSKELKSSSKEFGFENAFDKLELKTENTVEDIKYYRAQQMYQGYPVYGKSIVIMTDKDGNSLGVTGNAQDIFNPDLSKGVSAQKAKAKILSFIKNDLGYSKVNRVSIANLSDKNLCIYKDNENYLLAYKTVVNFGINSYEMVISAKDGRVLFSDSLLKTKNVIASGKNLENKTVSFNTWEDEKGTYWLYDDERNITVYTANNKQLYVGCKLALNNSEYFLYLHKDGDEIVEIWHNEAGNLVEDESLLNDLTEQINEGNYEYFGFTESLHKPLYSVSNKSTKWNDKKAISVANYADETYRYFEEAFKRKGFDGKNSHLPIYFDDYLNGKVNAYSYGSGSKTLLSFGAKCPITVDVIAHEYMHSIEQSESEMNYSGESGAIMEAYSDIFGEIIQDYSDNGKLDNSFCDWENSFRNIRNPNETNNPQIYNGENWADTSEANDHGNVHNNSTVISHVAYEMVNDENYSLSMDELSDLWYNTMLTLPSDCSFIYLRHYLEAMARKLGFSTEKQKVISNAFAQANIGEAVVDVDSSDYEKVTKNFKLSVLDINSTPYDNYSIDINGKQKKYLKRSNYNLHLDVDNDEPVSLNLENGKYTVTITDKEDVAKTSVKYIEIDSNGSTELKFDTDFGTKIIPVTDFNMDKEYVITIGEVYAIEPEITPMDATGYSIKWSSSDESVATISPTGEAGIITSLSKGTTTITAELTSGGKTIKKSTNVRVASKARDTVLVLDISGSMSGQPLEEMKKSAIQFCNDLLKDEYNNRVGIVFYDDEITTINLTNDLDMLISRIQSIYDGATTNMEAGLSAADTMLANNSNDATIKNIVIMADGLPNEGKTSYSGSMPTGDYSSYYTDVSYANAVIDTAKSIMNDYNLYSLGFFHGLYGDAKDYATALMKELTNQTDGYHQVDKAEDLQFAFGDISEEITVGSKIIINIACPVDVEVSYEGEMLSSKRTDFTEVTSFGTLRLLGKNKDIKVLSLDSDKNYDIKIIGTGEGKMDYSVNYLDESESLSDYRSFESVPITTSTLIYSDTDNNEKDVSLNIDENGDGEIDVVMTAAHKSKGVIVDDKTEETVAPVEEGESFAGWIILLICVLLIVLIGGSTIIIILINEKNNNENETVMEKNVYDITEPIQKDYPVTDDVVRITGVIQVTNGSMNGFSVPIKDGEVLYLGKDAKIANLVFTNDYKNVSRIHCSVTFDAKTGKYYVTDCSTNGTYFINRKRLIKGKRTPVNINTVLLLANDECTILLN